MSLNVGKNTKFPVRLLISVLMIAALVRHMGAGALTGMFSDIHGSAWGVALALLLAQILILTWRWTDLLNPGRTVVSYGACLRMTIAGQLANTLLITAIGGAVVRVGLAKQAGIPLPRAISAALADRLMTFTALLILAALTLPAFIKLHDNPELALWLPVAMACSAAAFALTIFIMRGRIAALFTDRGKLGACFAYLRDLAGDFPLMARILVVSLAAQIIYFAAVFFIVRAAGVDVGFSTLLVVLPVIALVASLPLSIGGWGIREGAFVFGLGLLGVPMGTAFVISVQIGVLCLLATVIAGLPALLNPAIRRTLLRRGQAS